MARIAGVDLPKNKRGEIGLTYIFGIGRTTAQYILNSAGIDLNKKVNQWNDDELNAIRNTITNEFKVEGALRSEVQMDYVIVRVCRFVVSVPVPTAVRVKVSVRQLLVRRR
jgi:small subunit ribosomal protein S13